MSEPQEFILRWRGQETGPYPVSEINRKLDEHEIGMGHEIFQDDKWITLEEFFAVPAKPFVAPLAQPASSPRLAVKISSPPIPRPIIDSPVPVPPAAADRNLPGAKPRHRLVFALLGVFFGFVGVHNFYARQWLTGILQLLLSIATCLMGFGIIASWVWAMVEAVVVRRDANGIDMI